MSTRVLIIKNISREGPGLLRDVLQQHRIEADVIELDRGESIPKLTDYAGLIVLGGPASANDDTPEMRAQIARAEEAIAMGMPYLGICLGHQVLAKAAGASIVPMDVKEVGFTDGDGDAFAISLTDAGRGDALFEGLPDTVQVFQLHGE